ncbi:hypothetical protein BH23CHL7_BH23CHL7_11870 [soil metagenome]
MRNAMPTSSIGLRALRATLIGVTLLAVVGLGSPGAASAHPLGNFTTNQYDGLTVSADRVQIDHVVDMAEIPALQERQRMTVDGSSGIADQAAAAWAETACLRANDELLLSINGQPTTLSLRGLGVSFPAGQAGLSTLRLVCTLEADVPTITSPTTIDFENRAYPDRLGWREITVQADGLQLTAAAALVSPVSMRLTAYPESLQSNPPDQRSASFVVAPGGQPLIAPSVVDAVPVGSPAEAVVGAAAARSDWAGLSDLPDQIEAMLRAPELTPFAVALALVLATLLGAVHAASPGHGKALMAAYLVGSRGTLRHAAGLGLTVTVAHTAGVFVLGLIILGAGAVVSAERLFPILGLASGLLISALGLVMLAQRLRERRVQANADGHAHPHPHDDHHSHNGDRHPPRDQPPGWHYHGPVGHSHLPSGSNPLRARNLAALGLIGGLVPSASAILILVGSIAVGRPGFGLVLTVAFGLGMAAVLVGLGVLLVKVRGLVEALPSARRLTPIFDRLPLVTALVFVVVGATILFQSSGQLL